MTSYNWALYFSLHHEFGADEALGLFSFFFLPLGEKSSAVPGWQHCSSGNFSAKKQRAQKSIAKASSQSSSSFVDYSLLFLSGCIVYCNASNTSMQLGTYCRRWRKCEEGGRKKLNCSRCGFDNYLHTVESYKVLMWWKSWFHKKEEWKIKNWWKHDYMLRQGTVRT